MSTVGIVPGLHDHLDVMSDERAANRDRPMEAGQEDLGGRSRCAVDAVADGVRDGGVVVRQVDGQERRPVVARQAGAGVMGCDRSGREDGEDDGEAECDA